VNKQVMISLAVLMVAGFLIYALGTTLNFRRYSDDVVEEMLYFPSGHLLEVASMGYETLVADLLWLRGIQYYGEHRRTDRSYPLAEHVFSTITDLDPLFMGAYRFGAFVLTQDVGQPVAGIRLIKKGMLHNPGRWQLPFDLGFLYFIEMDDHARAAHFFRFASWQDEAPDLVKRFSAFAYRKAGKTAIAKALWKEIQLSSANNVMKETADHALKNILRDELAESLAVRVESFRSTTGRMPRALSELVGAGLLRSVPPDPFGGEYFIDSETATVLSTSAVSEQAGHTKRDVERLLKRYRSQKGGYPRSLADLENAGLVESVPQVPGTRIVYDPENGTVDYVLTGEMEQ
jgi:hypothetical protein